MTVAILLSVYKPSIDFLKRQINSIICSERKVKIYIRFDDGCVLNELLSDDRIIFDSCLDNLGIEKSFRRLMSLAFLDAHSNFMFCDQDDIWINNKLTRACEILENSNGPCLVTTKYELIDSNENLLNSNFIDNLSICFPTSIFRNTDNGNCMAFNRQLANIYLKTKISSDLILHDSWMHILGQLIAEYHLIDHVYVKYRQHDNNIVGMRAGVGYTQFFSVLKNPYYAIQYRELIGNLDLIGVDQSYRYILTNKLVLFKNVYQHVKFRYILAFYLGYLLTALSN